MCGRYTQTKNLQTIKKYFKVVASSIQISPRYNIAPSQSVPIVVSNNRGRLLKNFQWGFVPHWIKYPIKSKILINARAETVHKKPSFKYSFKSKRCLIPADGFYEWQNSGKQRSPQYICLKNHALFAFAGIWTEWKNLGQVTQSFCIITTEANTFVKPIHNRMPVILPSDQYEPWLEVKTPVEKLTSLLCPYPGSEMVLRAVSKIVNSPMNDGKECLIKKNIE